jgi:hypothetical protein
VYNLNHNAVTRKGTTDFEFLKPGDVVKEKFYTYSTVEDVQYPWNPAIVRAIRTFDPDMIPATVKRIMVTPAGTEITFIYHAILRRVDAPLVPHPHFSVRMGHSGATIAAPNVEDLILEGEKSKWAEQGGYPGVYIPMTWDIYYRVKRAFYFSAKHHSDLAKEILAAKAQFEAKQEKDWRDEVSYRFEHDLPFMIRQGEKVSGPEINSIGYAEREKKPFTLVGKHAKGN